jgi:transposase
MPDKGVSLSTLFYHLNNVKIMKKNLFIGIDISKLTIDVAILFSDQDNFCHCQFQNNKPGFKKLIKWVKSFKPNNEYELFFGFEETGKYSINISNFFTDLSLKFVCENPFKIKRSMGIIRGKNDKDDSKMIALYLKRNYQELRIETGTSKVIQELKQLNSLRERLLKDRSIHKTRFKETKILTESIEVNFILKQEAAIILLLNKKIKEVEVEIKRIIELEEALKLQKKLLCTVPGVGEQIANQMLILTRGFTRFDQWRKFSCYAGLAPFQYLSGTSIKSKSKVSKIANKRIKALLTMGALTSIRCHNEYRKYYDKKTGAGKHPMVVLNAIKNKIVSRMFAVIERQTPYVCLQQ